MINNLPRFITLMGVAVAMAATTLVFSPVGRAEEQKNGPGLSIKGLPKLGESVAPIQTETIDKAGEEISKGIDKVGKKGSHRSGGDWVNRKVIYGITWFKLMVCTVLFILVLVFERAARAWIKARLTRGLSGDRPASWGRLLLQATSRPLSLLIWVYGTYGALSPLFIHFQTPKGANTFHTIAKTVADIGGVFAVIWIVYRWFLVLINRVESRYGSELDIVSLLRSSCRDPFKLIILAITWKLILPIVPISETYSIALSSATNSIIIGSVAWLILKITYAIETLIFSHYKLDATDNIVARRIHTHFQFLKKLIIIVVIVVAVASILMQFQAVRQIGTGILASAGIVGIVVGLASQRTIANLLVGLQIAITQPIRIDDVVIVENEWGRIEEITSTYVVVKLWDSRRLIVPLTYFAEKPFQNWTRVSADLLAAVKLHADYSLPVAPLRQEMSRILQDSPLWDGRVGELQVTGTTEHAIEVRALASAANASDAWNLRCDLREKLITFVQSNYPECLPKFRTEIKPRQILPQTTLKPVKRPPNVC
jgi:small-conductance mechanosensitive channel